MGRIRKRVDKTKESLFTAALQDIETGKLKSIRAAAEHYGLKYETLRDRKRGSQMRSESHEDQMLLTIEEEKSIEEWIVKIDDYGWPPRLEYVREMALGFIRSHGIQKPILGGGWITQFLDRHPLLVSRFTNRLDKQHAYAENPEILRDFFKKVFSLIGVKETVH